MAHELILSQLALMEASGTSVFFGYATKDGMVGKTDIMSPEAARTFLDVTKLLKVTFETIWMGRAEQF